MRRREFCLNAAAASLAATLPGRYLLANGLAELPASIEAVTSAGHPTLLAKTEIMEFAESMRGALLVPGSDNYDHARAVWNALIDKSPAMIAQCEGAADVAQAVNFARDHDLRLSVRGGGHSISGKAVCEGGLMVDLSNMNTVRVDELQKTARADGGCLEGHIDHEAALFGLATTGGIVSHTGAAGLTLGGGFGRVCRRFGMACDNLISVDMVNAKGQFLHVDKESDPELLWALQGGGGNFGIVTALEYRLHEMSTTVIGGDINFAWQDAARVLGYYADHGQGLADELNLNVILVTTPDGTPMVSVECTWCGDPAKADAALAELRSIAKPVADTVGPVRYSKFQTRLDNSNRHGVRMYMKSGMVEDFSDKLVQEIVDSYQPNPMSAVFFMQAGGAVSRVAPDATAFPHRSAHCNMMRWNQWFDSESEEQRAERIADVRSHWQRLQPYTNGYYVNLNEEDQARTNANYGDNYARLAKVKAIHDPHNLLRMNANILPTAS